MGARGGCRVRTDLRSREGSERLAFRTFCLRVLPSETTREERAVSARCGEDGERESRQAARGARGVLRVGEGADGERVAAREGAESRGRGGRGRRGRAVAAGNAMGAA